MGNLEPIPGSIGHKARFTLDRVPIQHRAQSHTHSHTHSYTTDTLDMPVSLPCMSLDWGRKPEYPEETTAARGEHANSHTEPRWESNPRPWRCEASVLTTKPPCAPREPSQAIKSQMGHTTDSYTRMQLKVTRPQVRMKCAIWDKSVKTMLFFMSFCRQLPLMFERPSDANYLKYAEETPAANGKHANAAHTEPRWESNPRPWRPIQ
ncbi:uncharacterized protein LOC128600070 isoform X2 [Ictalurus furcatus]|uniref:uncharacterized protein LOC128600070 isoform X2 n=1 Tax=Ictalurus furcatus TaxID=66913 RepID=UPI0023506F53|nr:uncharacterized protein LOC128600070 isoform X2 [Ictalurus furcatus]